MSEVIHGDCLDVLKRFPDNHFDSCCTDPPYDLTSGKKGGTGEASLNLNSPAGRSRISTGGGFMGKEWDATGIAFSPAIWEEVFRTLKPGAHLLAFGGTRTYHRMACAIEDAGFEIRDSLHWIYGSGFPKSLDVSKAIDKTAGAEREVIGYGPAHNGALGVMNDDAWVAREGPTPLTAPATAAAKQWEGWGTALKPAHEPIVVARKPLAEKTVAANVVEFGTGGLNIDGCRVEGIKDVPASPRRAAQGPAYGELGKDPGTGSGWDPNTGRWPPNILLSPEAAAEMDRQSGTHTSGKSKGFQPAYQGKSDTALLRGFSSPDNQYDDTGGASRFFPCFKYNAKAPKSERPSVEGISSHPTVKPLELIRWLVRLVTPPGGMVLDPFAGSGTTGEACRSEGFGYTLIEREADYIRLINKRMQQEPSLFDDWEVCGLPPGISPRDKIDQRERQVI